MKTRLPQFTLLIVPSFALAFPAFAGEIRERMNAPVAFEFSSNKRPASLEYCVGDAISSLGPVAALRDGPDRVIVTASAPSGRILVAVELNGSAGATQLIGHVYGPRWNDKMRNDVANCS
jgi:hypothetical protein